jgi:nitrite reductase/ring-hydroxylating ferredoxin subunit
MFKNRIIKLTKIIIVGLSMLTLITCAKDQNSFLPYVPVNFYINLAANNHLTIPGNSYTDKSQGYGGVIVMCVSTDPAQYYAFDACCPYETLRTCSADPVPVKGLSSGMVIFSSESSGTCNCCGSVYSLWSGAPTKGPSLHYLQLYQAQLLNGDQLWVHN